jgi:hypothetical protein
MINFSAHGLGAEHGVEEGCGLEFVTEHLLTIFFVQLPGGYMYKGLVGPDFLGSFFFLSKGEREGVSHGKTMSEAAV